MALRSVRCGAFLVFAATFASSFARQPTRAEAAVDATGRWDVVAIINSTPISQTWDIIQIGTTLDVIEPGTGFGYYSGTIDVDTGAFSGSHTGCGLDTISGTVSGDTLAACGVVNVGLMCTPFTFTAVGGRLDCGNSTIDVGEDCDDGVGLPAVAGCCTIDCRSRAMAPSATAARATAARA